MEMVAPDFNFSETVAGGLGLLLLSWALASCMDSINPEARNAIANNFFIGYNLGTKSNDINGNNYLSFASVKNHHACYHGAITILPGTITVYIDARPRGQPFPQSYY